MIFKNQSDFNVINPNDISGCIAYWNFDESGTYFSDETNTYIGSFIGTPEWQLGRFGSSIFCSGTNSMVAASGNSLNLMGSPYVNPGSDFCISFWGKFPMSYVNYKRIAEKGGYANNGWSIQMTSSGTNSNTLLYYHASGLGWYKNMTMSTYNPNTWEHWILNKTGSLIKSYKNSVDTGSSYFTYYEPTNDFVEFVCGNGAIDDFAFYERGLTKLEIQQLYNHGHTKFTELQDENQVVVMKNDSDFNILNPRDISGCVAYYPFNGNSDDIINNYDGSGISMTYEEGRIGSGANLNGIDANIVLPNINNGDFTSGISISLWMKNNKNNFNSTSYLCEDYSADYGALANGSIWKGRQGIDASGGKLISTLIPNTEYGSKTVALYCYQDNINVDAGTYIIKDNEIGTIYASGNLSRKASGDADKRATNPYILELNGHDVLVEVFFSDNTNLYLDFVSYGNGGYDGIVYKNGALSIIEWASGGYRTHINGIQINLGAAGDVDANSVWQHVVFTYDNQNFKIYKNGALLRTTPFTTVITTNTNSFVLGNAGIFNNGKWWGSFDEVGFFNRPLSQIEIQQLYQNGYPKFHTLQSSSKNIFFNNSNLNNIILKEVK